jgi:hypothetical protein
MDLSQWIAAVYGGVVLALIVLALLLTVANRWLELLDRTRWRPAPPTRHDLVWDDEEPPSTGVRNGVAR